MGGLEASVKVGTPEALAAMFYPNGRLGGLSVPGKPPGALGQRVGLLVQVVKPSRQFLITGQLAWVRHKAGPQQPMGFGLDFLPEEDAVRVRLLAFARKEVSTSATRAELRQPVEMEVRLEHNGRQRKELMADLSLGGAFVRTWDPLPVGALVRVFLRPRLALTSLEIKGQVAWVRLAGEHAGMGLEFDRDPAMQSSLDKLLAKLAR